MTRTHLHVDSSLFFGLAKLWRIHLSIFEVSIKRAVPARVCDLSLDLLVDYLVSIFLFSLHYFDVYVSCSTVARSAWKRLVLLLQVVVVVVLCFSFLSWSFKEKIQWPVERKKNCEADPLIQAV